MTRDEQFMQRALALAELADGQTHPNPMVGAVVVRAGRVVGEGYHHRAGAPHAEVLALRVAGKRAKGATLYVTLEPCCHQGRTPPCTETIIASGVQRVVYAMRDPNPHVAGKGLRQLRRAGIAVSGPVCRRQAEALNPIFLHWITTQRPYVIVKVATTLDGRIADADGASQWITNAATRAYAHRWRSRVDAILVGRRTAEADDPRLTVRLPKYTGPQPQPILWIGNGPIPWTARLLQATARPAWCVVATPRPREAAKLAARGHTLLVARNIPSFLRLLGAQGIGSLLVEGGGHTIGRFFQQQAVNYVVACVAPKMLGADGVPWIAGTGWRLRSAPHIHVAKMLRFDDNVVIEGPLYV